MPDVYQIIPEAEQYVLHIIKVLYEKLKKEQVKKVLVVAAEGTLKQNVYGNYMQEIECITPTSEYWKEIRYFIECVKQNQLTEETVQRWNAFLEMFQCENVILGCTEFPVLVQYVNDFNTKTNIKYRYWDPLQEVLVQLKEQMV